jgi:hypothetical protein
LLACSAYCATLKIESLHCSEISVTVYQIIQHHIAEDFTFHSSRLQERPVSTQSACLSSATAKDPYLHVRLVLRVLGTALSGDGLSLSLLHYSSAFHFFCLPSLVALVGSRPSSNVCFAAGMHCKGFARNGIRYCTVLFIISVCFFVCFYFSDFPSFPISSVTKFLVTRSAQPTR